MVNEERASLKKNFKTTIASTKTIVMGIINKNNNSLLIKRVNA